MAKSKKAPEPTGPPIMMKRAVESLAAVREMGQTGWKDNKYGFGEGLLSCYSCEWFEPYDILTGEPRPPQGSFRAGIDPDPPVLGASVNGYCRAEEVNTINMNLDVLFDGKTGYFKTSTSPENGGLNEVIIIDSTEFWCRFWTRTLNNLPWPPLYPFQPNGPSVEEE